MCRGLDEQVQVFRERPLVGAYPYLWLGRQGGAGPGGGWGAPQGPVIADGAQRPAAGSGRPGRRRGRDRELLAGVPAIAAGPGLEGVQLVHLRRPHRPPGRHRQGVRLFLAALHRAFPQRHARPRRPGPAAAGVGRDPWHLHRRLGRTRPRSRLGQVVDQLCPHAPKVARLLEDAEADLLAFYGSRSSTGPSSGAPTRWSGSTARSAGAQMWWGSSPTTPRCCGWPGCCCWNKTTSGWSRAAACQRPPDRAADQPPTATRTDLSQAGTQRMVAERRPERRVQRALAAACRSPWA